MKSWLSLFGMFALTLLCVSGLMFSAAAEDSTTTDVAAPTETTLPSETTAPVESAQEGETSEIVETGVLLIATAPGEPVSVSDDPVTTVPATETALQELPVRKVKLSPEIGVGEKIKFPIKGLTGPRTFYTSDPEVAVVDSAGRITAVGLGSVEITAAGSNEVLTGVLEVANAPTSLSLPAKSMTLGKGEKATLTVTLPENEGGTVKFKTSDSRIARVDENGTVTALRTGKVTITAKAYNGVYAKCKVQVKKAPGSISFPVETLEIAAGDTYALAAVLPKDTASKITYTSSEPEILELDDDGNVRTFDPGKLTVTAKTFNGKVARCKVRIVPAVKQYSLNVSSLKLGVGETFALKENIISYHTTTTVSKPGVVSLSGSFELTAKKVGKTTIKFKNYDGQVAKVVVTVLAAPTSISLNPSSLSVHMGKRTDLTYSFPKGCYASVVTFRSANPSVAEVDAQGCVWAKLIGQTTVTATAYNGVSASLSVSVNSMGVPFVSQLPSYPTGCEAASCTALLRYYGVSITLSQMVDAIPRQNIQYKNGRRIGPDINEKFVGNPAGGYTSRTPGYGAFSPCITKSLNRVLEDRESVWRAKKLSGCTFEELIAAVCEGRPAIVWATYRMRVPTSVNSWYIPNGDGTYRYFQYPRGTHVFVLKGISAYNVTLMDPILGTVTYSRDTFEKRWNLLGRQAIVLEREA